MVVIYEAWLEAASYAMDVTTQQAGVILAMIFTMAMIALVLIATRGHEAVYTVPITSLFPLILFTYMEWLPLWTGSAMAFAVTLFLAYRIKH